MAGKIKPIRDVQFARRVLKIIPEESEANPQDLELMKRMVNAFGYLLVAVGEVGSEGAVYADSVERHCAEVAALAEILAVRTRKRVLGDDARLPAHGAL